MFAVFEIRILNAENTPDDVLYDGRVHISPGREQEAQRP